MKPIRRMNLMLLCLSCWAGGVFFHPFNPIPWVVSALCAIMLLYVITAEEGES
jgi:hypothetical protein